jgi:uncharacterized protein YjbJ (UPF0337 family)
MKNSKIKNKAKKITGQTKEVVNKLTGDKELEIKGAVQKNVGKIQASREDHKGNKNRGS